MTEILYYPGFEIEDEEWLKFALLYMNEVQTIVPYEADRFLSDRHKWLKNSTNLIRSCRPSYEEGEKSTYESIEIFQRLMENPIRRAGIVGEINILEYWRQPTLQETELYRDKFSPALTEFFDDYGICHRTENGIKVPRQLALIYMSVFAHNIGDHRGIPVITDIGMQRSISRINNKAWSFNPAFEELQVMKKVIELQIPTDLSNIPLEAVIRLRNKESFRKKLFAFHSAINQFTNTPNMRLTERNCRFINEYLNESVFDLTSEITGYLSSTVSTALGIGLVFANNGSDIELVKELMGLGFLSNGSIQIYNKIQQTHGRYLAARYLTDLKKLGRKNPQLIN
jgi:hypothetical protein